MKVLSVKEPYATLICSGNKHIETRSWKTNYRGELFIHASRIMVAKKDLAKKSCVLEIIKGLNMNCGNIICKANLVDCIYMDDEFLESIKHDNKEYSLGLYKIGRYAWVLDNIEPIKPIPAKGKLGIWNYDGGYEVIQNDKRKM